MIVNRIYSAVCVASPVWALSLAISSCSVAEDDDLAIQTSSRAMETDRATLVRTIRTSSWRPASPDPAGITYISDQDRLFVSDSEVNEMAIFTGDNLYSATRSGSLRWTSTSLGFAREPTGVGYRASNRHLFVSDDDADRIFEVDPGADGRHGTSDDRVTSFPTKPFGSADPEGVAFASTVGHLFIIDGEGRAIHRINPGPNGRFEGESGDDQITKYDVARHGATDPEGIAFNSATGTLLISDRKGPVLELSTTGALIRKIDISDGGSKKGSGITLAPASNGSGALHMYIVNRGVDNGADPNENDGKIYEMTVPSSGRGPEPDPEPEPEPDPEPEPGDRTIDRRISTGTDDVEQSGEGRVSKGSSDLELGVHPDTGPQVVVMRFRNIAVPRGAVIESAYVQFQADEKDSEPTTLSIAAHAVDNASTPSTRRGALSRLTTTTASVEWSPPPWRSVGEAGSKQRTSDLAPVIQEIVDRGGWRSGNALALVVTGTGVRTAESYNGISSAAPRLHIEYR